MKSHIDNLEAESIYIIREALAESKNPVMLYSLGKDSSVMLHIAKKAFFPGKLPFPLLHVDTKWKFKEMYQFRDKVAAEDGIDLRVFSNPKGIKDNINPIDNGSEVHTDIMKTQALKMALDQYKYDLAFGGARRDEEKSRAKERIFSFRTKSHKWDPKNQRPELWNNFNTRKKDKESIRVFPLSNWTELDVWQYIYQEKIDIVPLYFSSKRKLVNRDGMLIDLNDSRLTLLPDEKVFEKQVRFRTLGCYPLTGAVESNATTLDEIVLELIKSTSSERQGRAIDKDENASMEQKKKEGYF
jgi:sulfate adenylyltransferase subunit 2